MVTAGLNVAVQVDAFFNVILVEAAVPEQLPDHPLKVEPDFAAAVSVTRLPTT